MSDAVWRYLLGLVLCALVALAYSATRKRGLRAILFDCLFCFSCMMAVVAAVGVVVYVICALK